jgi:hypothetical protein
LCLNLLMGILKPVFVNHCIYLHVQNLESHSIANLH